MEFSPELLRPLLIALGILAAATAGGYFIERLLAAWLAGKADEAHPGRWRIWRGLGGLSGAWIGLGIISRHSLITGVEHGYPVLLWEIAGVFISTVYLARVLGRVVQHNTRNLTGALPSVSLFGYVITATVYILGALIILQLLGISITPILTALGVGGLAVALALQDTLGNLFAGIQIIASRKFKPGQFVTLESGHEGYITDIAWRTTAIKTPLDTIILVPNKTITNSIVTNTWLPDNAMFLEITGEVGYGSDLDHVEQVIAEMAADIQKNHKGAAKKHVPTVRFSNFGASGIGYTVKMRALEYDWQDELRHELIKALHSRFRQEGIEIPFPVRTIRFEEESK